MVDIEGFEDEKDSDEITINSSKSCRGKASAESLSKDQNLTSCVIVDVIERTPGKYEDHTSIFRSIDASDEYGFSDESSVEDSCKDLSRFVREVDQVLNSVRDQVSSTHKGSGILNNNDDGVKSTFSSDDEIGEDARKLDSASKSLNLELSLAIY
mmetsp:Transcript_5421/g.8314  ORF Transcript_5421/g.8314 Transcript_5421/m.8314 type:complete len:155 (-) Transcript_5421:26-490(-)